ncbi:Hypothetical_protein [Hexamita inflata]|uniref:Hypothetical_protein n=1 Tax=Hexamita inflata TaxID=28002 RepID=A0AA86TXG6_9EUKA|nr:Hypothetical protein HINF_LOCUS19666 [Hexamita inflata]
MKITHCSKEIAIYFLEEYEYDVDAAIKQFEADQQQQKLQQQKQQEHERVRKINEQSQIEAKLELDTQVRREQQIEQVIEFTGCSRDLAIMHLKQKYFIVNDQAKNYRDINVDNCSEETSSQIQCDDQSDDQNTDQDNNSDDATEESQEHNIFKQTVYVPIENNQIYPQNNLLFPQWNNQQYYHGQYQPGHYVNQYQGQSVQYQNQFRQNYWQNQPQYCNNQQQNRNNYQFANYQNQTAYNAQNKLEFNVPRFNPNVKYEPINGNFSSVQFK